GSAAVLLRRREEAELEPAEDVVDDGRRDGDLAVRREAGRLEVDAAELRDEVLERDAVLERDGREQRDGVHEAADRRAFLRDVDEDLAGLSFFIEPDSHVTFLLADAELMREGAAFVGEMAPVRRALRAGRSRCLTLRR